MFHFQGFDCFKWPTEKLDQECGFKGELVRKQKTVEISREPLKMVSGTQNKPNNKFQHLQPFWEKNIKKT